MTRNNISYYENDENFDKFDSPQRRSLDNYNEDEFFYEQDEYEPIHDEDDEDDEEIRKERKARIDAGPIGITLPTPRYNKNKALDFNEIMNDYHSNDPVRIEKAMNKVVNELGGIIYYIIKKKYARYSKKYFEDLVQQGNLGLFKGMKEYDPTKGKPSTFFYYYIVHEIQDFINVNINKTSTHYDASTRKIKKIIETYEGEDRKYNAIDLSIETGLPLETIKESLKILGKTEISYENAIDSGISLDSVIPSDDKTPEQAIVENETARIINETIAKILNKQELEVIEYYFGLHDKERLSVKKIAKKLDIPTDHVKRHLSMAYSKLKHSNLRALHPDMLFVQACEKNDENVIPVISDEYANMAIEYLKDVDIDF